MKSELLFCITVISLHSVLLVLPCKANGIFEEIVDFTGLPTSQPDIIGTMKDCQTSAQCATACILPIGNISCQSFQFHKSTGQCELLASASKFSDKAKANGGGWSTYQSLDAYQLQLQVAPYELMPCDEPWVEEIVNGKTEYVRYFDETIDADVQACLPIKPRIGTIFTIRGLRHRPYKTDFFRLEPDMSWSTVDVSIKLIPTPSMYLELDDWDGLTKQINPSPFAMGELFDVTMEYEAGHNIKIIINGDPWNFKGSYDPEDIKYYFKRGVTSELRIR